MQEQLPTLEQLWLDTLGWTPSGEVLCQFQKLYELILEKNQQLNLTKITQPLEFWEKHLWDSLAAVVGVFEQQKLEVIDIGTGAGFPGLPISFAYPAWQLTLVDSTKKKVNFLAELKEKMHLKNIRPLAARIEELGQDPLYREQYDLVLIRAVAQEAVCAEYALPLLKIGGSAILYRGQWSEDQTQNLCQVSAKLGGEINSLKSLSTPVSGSTRNCVYLKKTKSTSLEYPRAIGVPTHSPLLS